MFRTLAKRPASRGRSPNHIARGSVGLWPALRIGCCIAVVFAGGCGAQLPGIGGISTASFELPTITLPAPEAIAGPTGTPTEIYSRIARGVLTCWLGAHVALKGTHIFHAVSQPERDGGVSRIAIHERSQKDRNKRGIKAIQVTITPILGSASLSVENAKLPKPMAEKFNADVRRWAAGEEGCLKGGIQRGWDAAIGAQDDARKR